MAGELDKQTQEALARILSDGTGSLSEDVLGVFEECLRAFEYKGFDPDKIRKILAIRQSKMRSGSALELGSSKSIAIHGPKGLNVLVSFLLTLFNLRGNNLEAIKDGLEGGTKSSFEAIISALDLKSKVMTSGKPKSSETLTLARISAAFPLHSMSVVRNQLFCRQIIDLSDIGVDDSELGRCMQHPVCASTLTANMVRDGCQAITFLASLRLNSVIGVNQKTTPDKLWMYHLAILASKAVPETRKATYWNGLYSHDVVRGWIVEAKRALQKDIPETLFTAVDGKN
ncbi:hypothetical protein [Culex Bunya-like virus]|nr:hypothetical protein [Culex Bunya-like virus]